MPPTKRIKPTEKLDLFEELTFALENAEDCLEEAQDELDYLRKTLAQLQQRVRKLEGKAPAPRARARR